MSKELINIIIKKWPQLSNKNKIQATKIYLLNLFVDWFYDWIIFKNKLQLPVQNVLQSKNTLICYIIFQLCDKGFRPCTYLQNLS